MHEAVQLLESLLDLYDRPGTVLTVQKLMVKFGDLGTYDNSVKPTITEELTLIDDLSYFQKFINQKHVSWVHINIDIVD